MKSMIIAMALVIGSISFANETAPAVPVAEPKKDAAVAAPTDAAHADSAHGDAAAPVEAAKPTKGHKKHKKEKKQH